MEQLCINYANEKLHEQFNEVMFKMEQAEYEKEGVPWTPIGFVDNSGFYFLCQFIAFDICLKECIKLLEATGRGVLAMINEEVRIPKGTETTLMTKMSNVQSSHPFFSMFPGLRSLFAFHLRN